MNSEQIEALDKAINAFWNFNLTESESILSKYISKVPLMALLYSDIAFTKAVLTETKDDYSEATKRISECKDLARSLQLSQKPLYLQQEKDEKKAGTNGADSLSQFTKAEYLIAKLIYAETLVMKGVIEFKNQNNLKAGMALRKSWKQFYQAYDIVKTLPPTFPIYNHIVSCANYGVGIFHFLVSVVPPQYMWLVEGIGFKGNRMEGLNEIKLGASSNGIRSILSNISLILIHVFFFEDYKSADPILNSLMEKYNKGALIYYLSGACLRKQGKIKESTASYQKAFETSEELKQLQLFIESELGYNEFLFLNWQKSEEYLGRFLKETTSSGFKAFIAYQMACCQELQNNTALSQETFKTIGPIVRKGFDFDEFSGRKASKYLKKGQISAFERSYLMASCLNEAHQFEESIKILVEALSASGLSNDDLATGDYLLGSNYQQMGKKDEAKKHYQQALTKEKQLTSEYFVIPYSYVGLGEIAILEEKKSDAKNFIKQAKGYSKNAYDFPSVLDWRARKVLQQLGEF
ncbi:hypothetical protein DLAC_08870 [Tieghemostelium lacteum]|uniref:Tetratricopeptide repeat protein n=1 Tax=Tieghemostelium lacteum TaxID=361077 RepID=A0A151Z8K1_TIELA|nr:hypothetical protein DLAC_08870 [Tieghemostelium lacteum]|eukprot:KYQ90267.1 hypothetical protein DLAC_08870 [Tieghemostelium lacteum]